LDWIFVTFATVLGLLALLYVGFFVQNLLNVPEAGPRLRAFVSFFVLLTGVIAVLGTSAAFLAGPPLSDWGAVIAAADLTLLLLVLAAVGFSIGFRQMEEDGVGYLRFFQLGSSIVLVLAIAPAFFGFITYATRLQ